MNSLEERRYLRRMAELKLAPQQAIERKVSDHRHPGVLRALNCAKHSQMRTKHALDGVRQSLLVGLIPNETSVEYFCGEWALRWALLLNDVPDVLLVSCSNETRAAGLCRPPVHMIGVGYASSSTGSWARAVLLAATM